jgi:hypothetical protein
MATKVMTSLLYKLVWFPVCGILTMSKRAVIREREKERKGKRQNAIDLEMRRTCVIGKVTLSAAKGFLQHPHPSSTFFGSPDAGTELPVSDAVSCFTCRDDRRRFLLCRCCMSDIHMSAWL